MRFLISVVSLIFCLLATTAIHADVVWNRGLDKGVLASATDSLFNLVSSSARPGGVRSVELNGQKMVVLRLIQPDGDDGDFVEIWEAVREQQNKYVGLERLDELLLPHKTMEMLSELPPLNSVFDNVDLIAETASEEFHQSLSNAKSLITERLEHVTAYETPTWRGVARIPVSAIDASSSLVSRPQTDGFIVIGEKNVNSKKTGSFWMFRFGEDFNILEAIGSKPKDPKKAADLDAELPVEIYPASNIVMSFSEDSKGWKSDLWSMQSKGDVLSHATHYLSSFKAAGFEVANVSEARVDTALMQFRKPGIESTLFIDLINPLTHDVQVTLQSKYPP